MRGSLLAAGLLALLVVGWPAVANEDTDRLVQRALEAEVSGDSETARQLLSEALAIEPSHIEANYALGWLLQEDGKAEVAMAQYRKVLALAGPADPFAADAREALHQLQADKKLIALAFDDFPFALHTPKTLDTLKELGIPVTFFAIGFKVTGFPHLAQRATAEGHNVQNHTYSHSRLTGLEDWIITDEIQRSAAAIEVATGLRPHLLRAPGGQSDAHIRALAWQAHHILVEGLVTIGDYALSDAETVRQRVLTRAKPGCIISLHDGVSSTIEALPGIVSVLRAKGYTFVTVDELIGPLPE